MPLGGGHRRKACEDPEVIAANSHQPEALSSWTFDLIDARIFDDPDVNLLLRAYAYFDNFENSSANRINTNDIERLATVWNTLQLDPVRYKNWQNSKEATITLLQTEVVLFVLLFVF